MSIHHLKKDDWGVAIHELGLRVADSFGSYDGGDLPNFAAIELLFRQAQLVEYAYAQDSDVKGDKGQGKGRFVKCGMLDEAAAFSGQHRDSGDIMVCPSLLDFVAKEIERDASVLKQVRKAREERNAFSGKASAPAKT